MSATRSFLLVDDSEDNRFLQAHALRRAFTGARIVEAATVEQALSAAAVDRFDGVITDNHLGAKEGPEFVQHLRAAGVSCPVVMVTASSDPNVHRRAYDAGAARVFFDSDLDYVGFFRRRFEAPA